MNKTAFHFLEDHDEALPAEGTPPEALAECIAPLGTEDLFVLRGYWNQVIWEECIPRSERVERVPSFAELDERRAERRMRRLSAATAVQDRANQSDPDAA